MVATNSSKIMKSLISNLERDFPDLTFIQGDTFYWTPKGKTVTYAIHSTQPEVGTWSLLHEVSHGILGHTHYETDFELVKLETEAWQHAHKLGEEYRIKIDPEHIQDCLDTYRDWLHRRSSCPVCATVSTQEDAKTYRCFNCKTIWHVSNSRFCRPYRRKAAV